MRVPCRLSTWALMLCVGQVWAQDKLAEGQSGAYQLNQNVRTVLLDVAVTDRAGHAVPGLKAEDFHIEEDGTAQRLNFFQGETEHTLPADTQGLAGQKLLAKSGDAPLTILLLDEISTEPEDLAYARDEVKRYLAKQPAHLSTPTTLLALTGSRLKRLQDYTTDRDALLQAVRQDNDPPSWYVMRDRQPGFKSTNLQTAPERLVIYLGTLKELAAGTQPYRTKKNLLWVGPGLPALNQIVALRGSELATVRESIHSVVSDLVRARLTLYTIDPQGIVPSPTQIASPAANGQNLTSTGGDPAEGELVFEQLAPETGGKIFRMRNDVDMGIAESVTDGAAYYTIGYTPQNKNFDGAFRRIRVTVRNPALIARTREGYNATADLPNRADTAALAMAFALTSGLDYGGVRVSARFSGEGTGTTLHLIVNTEDLQWSPDSDPGMEVATVSFAVASLGKDGAVQDYKLETRHARASGEAAGHASADFTLPYTPNRKAASLRVIVRDQSNGHIGSFDLKTAGPSTGGLP